ncbi:hypothetical protein [Rhodococcus globerulus]|uniref:hypothetical protein n=1 Tax=Rhodococcus globerulus TaxID=33008 RepID=UPI0005AABD21|nr:hypothetical protein [Rhodococcus globerulus]MCE4266304.1 hypothetical protein [Rhodococcus globerulus]
MLSKWDDYPIHQAAFPIAQTVSSDAGRYDRHWMAMHDKDLTTQVGFGLSVHPNRGIVDASISVSRNGRQRSTFASAPLRRDHDMAAGPLRLEVVEPMRQLRVVLDEYEGMSADLTFTAVTQHIEDSRMRRESGTTLISERVRTVQFGEWSGTMTVDGDTFECNNHDWWGFRDRSWGSRTTGTVAESKNSAQQSSIYFAWTLLRFDDECLLVAINETPEGISEARTVAVLPFLKPGDAAYGEEDLITRSDTFEFDIAYVPGTRRAEHVTLHVGPRGQVAREIEITPKGEFLMQGLGYYHPRWKHGTDHGGLAVGSQAWDLADVDPARIENVHAQQICRAQRSDGAIGLGLFEHVALGPHLPTGFPEGIGPAV